MSDEEKFKYFIDNFKKTYKNTDVINAINSIKFSKQNYASNDLSLIYRFTNVPEIGYNVICYKATKIMLDTSQKHIHVESIYAFVYVDVSKDDKNIYIKPKFVCASPTYTSRDGEYRQRFIPFEQILLAKNKYPELWSSAEEHILSKFAKTYLAELDDDEISELITVGRGEASNIISGDLILTADIYSSDDFEQTEILKKWANESRMAIHLFITAWFIDALNIYNNTEENHINNNYKIIIYDEDDQEFFDEWTKPEKKKQLNQCRNILSYIQTNIEQESVALRLGQKIIPLTVSEVLSNDMALGVWKEIVIANLCSNLVINGIAPGFALYGPWFFLQNIDSGIFDNVAMHEKFNFKNEIVRINDLLKDAQNTAWNEGKLTSADLDSLAKQVNDALRYSVSYLTTTDIAIVSISQWIGQTIRDIPRIYRNHRLNKQNVRWVQSHTFDTGHVFIKYIFDWIYSCHAMNVKFGALHGDLHLNNITIEKFCELYRMVDGVEEYKTGPNIPCSLYIIGETSYLFDSYGFCGGIIDYSRALLTDLSIIRKIDIAFLADDTYVQKKQQESLLRLMHKNFSELVEKNENRFKALIIEKFDLMMKIMFAIDPFNICDNIYLLLSAEFPHAFKKFRDGRNGADYMRAFPVPEQVDLTPEEEGAIDPSIPKLLAQIRDFSREYLVSNLHRAINGDINFPEDIEFIGDAIIKKYFGDYTFEARKLDLSKYAIYDIFVLENELKYSAFKTAEFEMRPEDLQTTLAEGRTKEFHRGKIADYLAMRKRIPEIKGKIETMRAHFKEPARLPIDSMWKYDRV